MHQIHHDPICPEFVGDGKCKCHVSYIDKLQCEIEVLERKLAFYETSSKILRSLANKGVTESDILRDFAEWRKTKRKTVRRLRPSRTPGRPVKKSQEDEDGV